MSTAALPPLCSSRHIRPIKTSRLSCPLGILNFDIDTHNVTVFERRSYCCSELSCLLPVIGQLDLTLLKTLFKLSPYKSRTLVCKDQWRRRFTDRHPNIIMEITCLAKIRCIRCLEVQKCWIRFSIINKEKLPSLNTVSSHGSINVNIEAAYCPLSHHHMTV